MSDAIAPLPFSAAAIRDATPVGRTYVVEMREGDGDWTRETWTFERSDDAGFLLVVRDTSGAEARRSEGTWNDLEEHGHFPAALTTIEAVQVESALGTRPGRLYTVRDPDDANAVRRFWFVDELPGAAVRMEAESGGAVVMQMRIVEHRASAAGR